MVQADSLRSTESQTGASGVSIPTRTEGDKPFRVLITPPFIPQDGEVAEYFRSHGVEPVFNMRGRKLEPAEIGAALEGVHAAIVAGEKLNRETLKQVKTLKVVARTGVGYDQIDVDYLTEHGVAVCITAGLNQQSVAEMAMTHILLAARRIPESVRAYDEGQWVRPIGRELGNATVGIIGLGNIAKRLVTLLKPYGIRILAADLYPDYQFAEAHDVEIHDWEYVLANSDFVSLHLFLDDQSKHWLNAEKIARMKPGAVLINTARGGVVDEEALLTAIRSGHIAGAGLDVTQNEPLALEHPLRQFPQIFITPHLGGSTEEARSFGGIRAAQNIVAVLNGASTPDVINPDALSVVH